MKIAIVHDWLTVYGGAERVLTQILKLFPQADLYSLIDFLPEDERTHLFNKQAHTSFLQKWPLSQRHYRSYLPFMPRAIESFDLSAYDLILSSSSAVAKGAITHKNQIHICYCNTPMRYAWDLQSTYLNNFRGPKKWLMQHLLQRLQKWDLKTAHRPDHYIANSHHIADRIKRCYDLPSQVIYPPVDVNRFTLDTAKEDYFLTASRWVPYKRIDLIMRAFHAHPDKKLLVVGDGPEKSKLIPLITPNITLLGRVSTERLITLMQKAKAFIFAAEEDFGIVPIEAQACGTPVIAFGKGGACETIRGLDHPEPTGCFFSEQSAQSISQAIVNFEKVQGDLSPHTCRVNAERFSEARFCDQFQKTIEEKIQA